MPRPNPALIVEDAWNRRVSDGLRERGWRTKIIPFTGYGSVASVRVLARVLMTRRPSETAAGDAGATGAELRTATDETRGWRAFVTTPAMEAEVTVTVNGREVVTRTDRGGFVDLTIRGHGLGPGWHTVQFASADAKDAEASVLIVGTTQTFGVISDIDDTVLSTSLPRPLVAAWNTFVRTEGKRRPVPGMATLYRELAAANPGMPFVYLSTGAWNTAPWLTRFLRRNGYPLGPMLLTDWGPTNTGWFRSGQDHKRSSLHRLARELPHVQWLLVGDDGQHDPRLYTEFATKRPQTVRAIAIRQLSTGEQVLSHGLPVANEELADSPVEEVPVPVLRGPDGFALARALRALFAPAGAHA
jgi:phosphatidate phosphatase APP1